MPKRKKPNKSTSQSPAASRAHTRAEENRLKAVNLHLRGYSMRQGARALDVAVSTYHGYIEHHREEVRSEGLLIARHIMVDDAAKIQRSIQILEAQHAQTKAYICRGCKERVACHCGEPVQVPVLKPDQVIRNRAEIRAQGESHRKLVGANAAEEFIVSQKSTEELKSILAAVHEHRPGIMEDLICVLGIMGHGDA